MDTTKLQNLKDLRTEAVEAFEQELREEFATLRSQELTVDGVTELTTLSTAINTVRTELSERAAAAAKDPEPTAEELAAAADAAAAAIELAEDAPAEADEPEAVDEPAADEEPVVAAAAEEVILSPAGVESDLSDAQPATAAITAGADIPGYAAGHELPSMASVAEAFISRRETLRGVSSAGDGDDVIVASIKANYPEERKLHQDAVSENMSKLNAVTSPEAITASGGLCAPLEPYYGIQVISAANRPVRDSLPKFNAARGGVRFLPPPRLSDLTSAIGVTTAAQDAGTYGDGTGGTTPYKPCLHVTCPGEQTAVIQAIHRCLTFGNFGARTYPEQVEAWLALAIAAHARRAETLLLDAIDAASTQVTAAASYSAVRTLLPQIDQATAAYRSRNRTAPGLALRIMLPDWTKELIRADLARGFRGSDVDPLSVPDSEIVGWFTDRNVSVTFYIDSATNAGQVFGAQGAGALTAFPSTVVWYLFVEGSFVFLDGGTLDLGLVRDSSLNRTNDYQIFAETFEAVAFFGIESLKITSTVCPNGVYAPAATAAKPCAVA